MTRLRRGRQTNSPTLCLERLEDRQLLNGAVWWVTPLISHAHAPDSHAGAKRTTVADVQSLTGQLLRGHTHSKSDLAASAAHVLADEVQPQIHQLLHSTSADHSAGHGVWAASGDHAHGGTKHNVEDNSSPTAQLIRAARQDEQQPSATRRDDNPHTSATSAAQPSPETQTDSDTKPVVSTAEPAVTHATPAAPMAQANTAAGQNNNSSSSGHATGSGNTGGNTGNHGSTHSGNGSGASQNNGKGGSTGKWWSHKGSGQSTGTPPPAHHGGAEGSGSHPIPTGAKSGHTGSGADSSSSAASQSAPGADADDSDDGTTDQSRALALALWDPDSSSASAHTNTRVGELSHDTGGGEPHGAVVMGRLDDAADTADGIGPAGHPIHVALADGDLELKAKPVTQPAEPPEPPPIAAESFEWLAMADGETAAPIVAAGMPEGCHSPAELIAVGLQETQAAMKQLLAQLAQLGQQATGALTAHGAGPWLVAAAAGAVAAEVVRRRLRSQPQPILVSAAQASTSTWFPGLLD